LITLFQFIAKLERDRVDYAVLRFYTRTYVDVGRFAYCFNEDGKAAGGWIHDCKGDAAWEDWMALLHS
jgi:hypothetical protein